jgi:hypothetical protein
MRVTWDKDLSGWRFDKAVSRYARPKNVHSLSIVHSASPLDVIQLCLEVERKSEVDYKNSALALFYEI